MNTPDQLGPRLTNPKAERAATFATLPGDGWVLYDGSGQPTFRVRTWTLDIAYLDRLILGARSLSDMPWERPLDVSNGILAWRLATSEKTRVTELDGITRFSYKTYAPYRSLAAEPDKVPSVKPPKAPAPKNNRTILTALNRIADELARMNGAEPLPINAKVRHILSTDEGVVVDATHDTVKVRWDGRPDGETLFWRPRSAFELVSEATKDPK